MTVLEFPKRFRRARKLHVRASAGSRAASIVILSAVRRAASAACAASTADHHSAGILSRCHHLAIAADNAFTAPSEASGPKRSRAMAFLEGHSLITARNDVGSDIGVDLGHPVLNCKDILSYDNQAAPSETAGMVDRMSESEEKSAFIRRVKLAREAKFDGQRPVYEFLGIAQDIYKQYETRTPLPHRYIPKFCRLTETSMEWLLSGEGEAPQMRVYPREKKRGRPPKAKTAAA